jgi:hypothetical protein
MTWADKRLYIGMIDIKSWLPHGKGEMRFPDGRIYS